MTLTVFGALFAASVGISVTPGPETMLVLRYGALRRRAGLFCTTGTALGALVWAVLAITGVAAIMQREPALLAAVKTVGGIYLLLLGAKAAYPLLRGWWATRRARSRGGVLTAATASGAVEASTGSLDLAAVNASLRTPTALSSFTTGLFTALTNPKSGLFFLAVLPTFIPADPTLVDYAIVVGTIVGCLGLYAAGLVLVADLVSSLLRTPKADMVLDIVSASVLSILGVLILAL
ncbi:LysE family translocator [Brevibacterium luteolum]|uniref:LysE family translocator n=1 Tax=Brevibacterium luteolum TaxID=199591 RepID=A0A849B0F1_9MICO|nr:LysE family translocator [Brevibacterium luteolum]MBM7529410.1 threonine/homoserine/homoserine lactone efflux protein [Brevibacterium luteolum]MCT1829411.1 LysE family translocator [Brevibacterium luteolum]NNG80334.1 LysE family translocator [Brevibacterium luteolum]